MASDPGLLLIDGDSPGYGLGINGSGGFVPPAYQSNDWTRIASLVAGRTEYRSINFAVTEGTGVALDGTYVILAVTADQITLSNPSLVNPTWANIDVATQYASPALSTTGPSYQGWFTLPAAATRVLANFVAENGLYEDDGKTQRAYPVTVQLDLQPVDENGLPIGPMESFETTIEGNANDKESHAATLWAMPTFSGTMRARASRITNSDLTFKGTVVDEVKWRDLFAVADVDQPHFGNVTTVLARTYATNSALSVKDRRLNMRVTRRLPQRISGAQFGDEEATVSADDILSAMCLDPVIGGMDASQVDFDNIYDTLAEVRAYFGSDLAGAFGYTFDDANMSAQEMITTVATAVFCSAYRQAAQLNLAFERSGDDATLIFNARNTLPATQKRSVRFGTPEDQDGVELNYLSHIDGAQLTVTAPLDGSAASPQSITMPGVQWPEQASWHLWRIWNRAKYQSLSLAFTGTDEAALLVQSDRILVADLTRATVAPGGEIEELDGTTATLSAPVQIDDDGSWTAFIQHPDGTIESIAARPVAGNEYAIELQNPPSGPLSLDPENTTRAKYELARDRDHRARLWVVLSRSRQDKSTHDVKAINYSFLYYQQDETVLWLSFDDETYDDDGPYGLDPITQGPGLVNDPLGSRGWVYAAAAAGRAVTFPEFQPPTSYTVTAWVRRLDTSNGSILGSASRSFGFAGSAIQAGHPAAAVAAAWPTGALWHHVAVTYDAPSETMVLLIDAAAVATADGVTAPGLDQLTAFADLVGNVDELRLWKRALTRQEIDQVYRSTLNGSTVVSAITTENDRVVTTDDGRTLTWQ